MESTEKSGPSAGGSISWYYDVPLFTDYFMIRDWIMVTALSLLIMQILLIVMSFLLGEDIVILPPMVYAVVGGIFMVLFAFATLVILGNRYGMTFTVDGEGVSYVSGGREKKINKVLLTLALLSGKPGPMGATMLAKSREAGGWTWDEIKRIKVYPGRRVISIRNSWRTLLRLYCPPENFEAVREMVERMTAEAQEKRSRETPAAPPSRPWYVFAGWILASVLSTAACLVWPWWVEYDNTSRFVVFAGALVLLSGVLPLLPGKLMGAAALPFDIYLAVRLAQEALETTKATNLFGRPYRGWEFDSPQLAVSAAGVIALIGLSLYRIFAGRKN